MIVSEPKPTEEILFSLSGVESVFIVSCEGCPVGCKSGGQERVDELVDLLGRANVQAMVEASKTSAVGKIMAEEEVQDFLADAISMVEAKWLEALEQGKELQGVSEDVMAMFMRHDFPGNRLERLPRDRAGRRGVADSDHIELVGLGQPVGVGPHAVGDIVGGLHGRGAHGGHLVGAQTHGLQRGQSQQADGKNQHRNEDFQQCEAPLPGCAVTAH